MASKESWNEIRELIHNFAETLVADEIRDTFVDEAVATLKNILPENDGNLDEVRKIHAEELKIFFSRYKIDLIDLFIAVATVLAFKQLDEDMNKDR